MKTMTFRNVAFFALCFFVVGGIAFAAQQPVVATENLVNFKTDGSLWKGILNGAIAGVMAAVLGWVKNRNTKTGEMERFEIKFLVPTALVGVLVGVGAALMKKTPADLLTALETSPIFGALVFAVEAGLKAIWRNTVPMVRDMISDVKAGAGNPTPPAPPTP
jgi:hypothetical protein